MIPRHVQSTIQSYMPGYPVIAITGPRQSGKTTLARMLFKDLPYISLENPDIKELAANDPRHFLRQYKDGAVFDEVQKAPQIISYLQQIVDEGPKHCRFVLTGSQQFGIRSKITQSLAGRVAMIRLLPFSVEELYKNVKTVPELDELLCKGFYPPIYDRGLDAYHWYSNYFQTYIERDVHQLINIRDISNFQKFVRLCAARTGQLLNLSSIANDCGITHNTVKAWISILEASYIVFLLQPYYKNYGKRLVKTPKIYFYDVGLASFLTGIQSAEMMSTHQYRGSLFENFIIAEIIKLNYNKGLIPQIYFWRDRIGNEVDLLIEHGAYVQPIEIKSGSTFNNDFIKGLKNIQNIEKIIIKNSSLIYGGINRVKYKNINVLPWKEFAIRMDTVGSN